MSDDPAKPPRFPYVGALLCAACLGAAVWTWMRYSYEWDVIYADFAPGGDACRLMGSYVKLRYPAEDEANGPPVRVVRDGTSGPEFYVSLPLLGSDIPKGGYTVARGRVVALPTHTPPFAVDSRCARLHGASIAGLVVGAMGVFVFAVALRHWLVERRRFLDDTKGHNQGMDRASDD